MKTRDCLNGISRSGLYFITSGEVKTAIGRADQFSEIRNPVERDRRLQQIAEAVKREVDASVKKKLQGYGGPITREY